MKHVLDSLGIIHWFVPVPNRSRSESYSHVSDCSVLGDGSMIFRCSHTLSQFYQDLSQEFPTPTLPRYRFPGPAPSRSVVAEFLAPHSLFYMRFARSAELRMIQLP